MRALLSKEKRPSCDNATFAWQTAFTDTGVATLIVMDDSVLYGDKKVSNVSICTACGEVHKVKIEEMSQIYLPGGSGTLTLDRVLHISCLAHNLVSVADLYDSGHNV